MSISRAKGLKELNIPDKSDRQVSYTFDSRHGVDCVPLQPFILGYSSACYHSSKM